MLTKTQVLTDVKQIHSTASHFPIGHFSVDIRSFAHVLHPHFKHLPVLPNASASQNSQLRQTESRLCRVESSTRVNPFLAQSNELLTKEAAIVGMVGVVSVELISFWGSSEFKTASAANEHNDSGHLRLGHALQGSEKLISQEHPAHIAFLASIIGFGNII